jgi:ABC-type branched-subunit amino acid transport system ATPase component
MSLAFGDACDALGLRPTVKDPATSLVAEKVIELAIGGVHDPNALRTMTLEAFSQNGSPSQGRATSRGEAKRSQNQRSVREPDRNGPAYQTFLLSRLTMTERRIAASERHVARQREIVVKLERHSRGNSETSKVAKELLQSLEMAQAWHSEDRERLRRALGV